VLGTPAPKVLGIAHPALPLHPRCTQGARNYAPCTASAPKVLGITRPAPAPKVLGIAYLALCTQDDAEVSHWKELVSVKLEFTFSHCISYSTAGPGAKPCKVAPCPTCPDPAYIHDHMQVFHVRPYPRPAISADKPWLVRSVLSVCTLCR
jgi:hypothetical protein